MTDAELKADFHRYLREAREALVWKLEGLSEYDLRRPLTPTGTNLLGLVKHLISVELLYLGFVFGRDFAEPVPWFRPDLGPDAFAPNTDMWATADESREYVVDLYQRVWKHADATIEELALDATGLVMWWPEQDRRATLHRILAHLIAETHRHVGHADIVRELIDGAAGLQRDENFLPPGDEAWWQDYRNRLERVAEQVGRN
ncbi:DinB family protein [Micromonospora sp. NBC_01699]|uniref:DinB family protein n=1 Tax=Micromonospora sp. NBC_01699 TaxID=2975984 RepID=UPI002E31A586|nr:DinB family protein [Micromonospora sp. NBC_01699]